MTFAQTLILVDAICCCGLALVALAGRRRNLAQWAFAGGMAALAAESVFSAFSIQSALFDGNIFWLQLRLGSAGFVPIPWLIFSLCYSRGNHREFLEKWLPTLVLLAAVPTVLVLGFHDRLVVTGPIQGRYGVVVMLGWLGKALNLVNLLAAILILMNLERTFRASVGTMRWRIKYMVIGLAVLFGARIYTGTEILLFSGVSAVPVGVEALAQFVGCSLIAFSLVRSRFSNVDIYPSHTVLHRSLTVLLAGSYLLVVGLLAKLVNAVGGARGFPIVALIVMVGLAGLSLILLSDRVRQGVRRLVSRHFRRPFYDYRIIWSSFNERMTSLLNETDVCREVAKLVAETFEVLSVTIWLIDEERKEVMFAASTALSEAMAEGLERSPEGIDQAIKLLRQHREPIEIDSPRAAYLAPLKRFSPEYFPEGGDRVCVPMVSGGQLTGLLAVGDRVGGAPFSQEDLELLKCIGDQVAACLRNIKLSQRLIQTREMEAFQTMSAFFVHDLKNTASTLSLMLQNLPAHFDDPSFRQDALRAVSKSVFRINDLINSLGVLRQELKPDLREADLNEVVEATLANLQPAGKLPLLKELNPLPKIKMDAQQMQKVITNLVLNANDAVTMRPDGQIRLQTFERNGWAVLSITDTGCGMSPEFLRKSLFRPFQTTKKRGIGIGAFHSKLIVEAHKGKIEVESAVGRGTTFRVLLPVGGEPK